MKVWITKYALTSGVFETDAVEVQKGMIKTGEHPVRFDYYHGEGIDWHRTQSGATKRFAEMKEKKIASLKAQIKKIEKLTY